MRPVATRAPRVARSVAIASGVIVAAGTAIAACSPAPAYGCPPSVCGDAAGDVGIDAPQAMYGGPPPDASNDGAGG